MEARQWENNTLKAYSKSKDDEHTDYGCIDFSIYAG